MDKENHLFTEDPYYLPRYCGYLPQFKYRIGKTYGHHSADILTDPHVQRSPHLVLTSTEPVVLPRSSKEVELLRTRQDSWGNQLHTDRMLPGYAGYIPKGQHYFARPYGDICRSALAQQEYEQRRMKMQRREDDKRRMAQTRDGSELRPSRSISEARCYTPTHHPPESLYFMKDRQDLWFKSGYTGFVPRTRELIALGYPKSTNTGLRVFNANLNANETRKSEPVKVDHSPHTIQSKAVIYPENAGMIPHYTGYIPGYKYKIGKTYGCHTYNTLKISGSNAIPRGLPSVAS